MEFQHTTILLKETIDGLNLREGGVYVDCTLGCGGHTWEIFQRLSGKCTVIGIDQDQSALEYNRKKMEGFEGVFIPKKSNFANLDKVLDELNIHKVDGFVFDLGVSSPQLDIPIRGFSYNYDAPLDMRMDQNNPFTAHEIVNSWSFEEIYRIIKDYGEDNWAKRIAQFIVENRPIDTTFQLVDVIKKAVPKGARKDGPHPAKRTFQAIRIAVNNELGVLSDGINKAIDRLNINGRICVITFHSLEDRIVKNLFKEGTVECICPKEFPVCMCHNKKKIKIITKKPIEPSMDEVESNPRSRSSKLRIAQRV